MSVSKTDHGGSIPSRPANVMEEIMSQSDRKFAVCVVVIRDGKVLAISRKPDHVTYGLPGGTLEPFETFNEAVIREMEEETGYAAPHMGDFIRIHDAIDVEGWHTRAFYLPDPGFNFVTQPNEGHLIWDDWSKLLEGPFKQYNIELIEKLKDFLPVDNK